MYQLLVYCLRPTFVVLVILALAIANLWRKRQETRARLLWVTVPFVLLCILCTPALGHLAFGTLEWAYPPSEEVPEDAGAIVVLSGHIRPPDALRRRAELGSDTLYRCLHARALYFKTQDRPILVSGGRPGGVPPGPAYAEVMQDFLREQGVPIHHLLVEDRSRNTHENAVESAKLLKERGVRRIVLVVDAVDMLRASWCFQKQGIEVVPSPCNHVATKFHPRIEAFLPSPIGAAGLERVAYEWLGTAYYWLRGRV